MQEDNGVSFPLFDLGHFLAVNGFVLLQVSKFGTHRNLPYFLELDQIGEDHPRSCSVAGRSSGRSLSALLASRVVH